MGRPDIRSTSGLRQRKDGVIPLPHVPQSIQVTGQIGQGGGKQSAELKAACLTGASILPFNVWEPPWNMFRNAMACPQASPLLEVEHHGAVFIFHGQYVQERVRPWDQTGQRNHN